jgi:ABC-type sugar transport system ATPase subunit
MTMGDRIAVMNDGLLEQCGTPEELYERPANRFVAGFIGSPAMSFFDASAERDGDGTRLRAGALDLRVPGVDRLPGTVAVGVRPEGARPWNGAGGAWLGPVRGTVEYVEALGRETFLGVATDGARLVIHQDGRATLAPGDAIEFGISPEGLRFFDPESGAALQRTR